MIFIFNFKKSPLGGALTLAPTLLDAQELTLAFGGHFLRDFEDERASFQLVF